MKQARRDGSEYGNLRITIGNRMRIARELSGMSQEDAAALLGYKNSSKLSKIELGTDGIPMVVIEKASQVYNVSSDFLFGLSDDPERNPSAIQERHINQVLEVMQEAQNAAIRAISSKFMELERSVEKFKLRAKENLECMTRVQELNPEFEELRGGAKLLRLLIETTEEAVGIDRELKKLREAEAVIAEVLQDPGHPANDPNHAEHIQAKQALAALKSKTDESRANIEAKRFYQN